MHNRMAVAIAIDDKIVVFTHVSFVSLRANRNKKTAEKRKTHKNTKRRWEHNNNNK